MMQGLVEPSENQSIEKLDLQKHLCSKMQDSIQKIMKREFTYLHNTCLGENEIKGYSSQKHIHIARMLPLSFS